MHQIRPRHGIDQPGDKMQKGYDLIKNRDFMLKSE